MKIEPDIALVGDERLPGVDTHAHAHPSRRERALGVTRGRHRIRGLGERDEDRIALRVDFDPVVRGDRGAKKLSLRREYLAVAIAELAQETRRSFDVREEECHGARWERAHGTSIRSGPIRDG